ncbi:hypothetical protein ACFLXM_01955 [Chloroflexota bacterium]
MKSRKLVLKILLSVALIVMVLNLSCTIAGGGRHTVGVRPDGTVVATGNNDDGQCNVDGWTDIGFVAAGFSHTVGVEEGGTVVATGNNDDGQCNVGGWSDMGLVVAGDWHTVGIKNDGSLVATGKSDEGQCDVLSWTDIQQVAAGGAHTVGLKDDGSVVATGRNDEGQCDVGGWTGIELVAAGYAHTAGLKDDGTVVATGENNEGQCNVAGWTNIQQVAAGRAHTVGLREDGSVVATGRNNEGQCIVSGWTNIVQVSAGGWHTLGLRDCGTVVATGNNDNGQCNVGGWVLETLSEEPPGTYHLTISSAAGGLVTAPGEGTFAYCESEVVNLVAEADACYEFVEWTGDVGTIADVDAASTSVAMDGDYFITASFVLLSYDLTTNSTGGGSVATPGEGTFPYDCGMVVDLVAEAEAGYRFVNWTGDIAGIADVGAATTTITMNDSYSVTADFEQIPSEQFGLIISSTAGGTVTAPGEGTFTYDQGTGVNLVAEAEEGYRFVNWTGDVGAIANVDAASTTITMNDAYSITANFEEKPSTNWPLIGGIIGAVVVVALVIFFVRRR